MRQRFHESFPQKVNTGKLFVVATPLGNLEDMSPRAVRALSSVTLVAAEDTRSAQRLFSHFQLRVPVLSYFIGNEAQRTPRFVERMRNGETIALISDAGLPGISDPGERLIRASLDANLPVEVVPGPSASLTALVGSGLPTGRFTFIGFLPRDRTPRIEELARLRTRAETLIFFEAPVRTATTLADLALAFGEARRACVARELTKLHEEYLRGTLAELAERTAAAPPRGEVTIVVEGSCDAPTPTIDLEASIDERLAAGQSPKEISTALAALTGKSRRQIYQLVLSRRSQRS